LINTLGFSPGEVPIGEVKEYLTDATEWLA
jgi:hypothetical protein